VSRVLLGTQQRKKGLSYRDQAKHIDLKVSAHLVQGLVHKRAGEGDASVIYEACQTGTTYGLLYFTGCPKHGVAVRDVE
jgi:hypothetical protein